MVVNNFKAIDMMVNNFKVGDGIILYGWCGTVVNINHENRNGKSCTYLQVKFDTPAEVGYQYENGWYGGLDNVVGYGYFKR